MSDPHDGDDLDEPFPRLSARDREAFDAILAREWDGLLKFAQGRMKKAPELEPAYDAEDAMLSGLGELWRGIISGTIVPPDGLDRFLRLARAIIGRRILARDVDTLRPRIPRVPVSPAHGALRPRIPVL